MNRPQIRTFSTAIKCICYPLWAFQDWREQISLPFYILQLVKSLPFHIPEARKRYLFRAEPSCIGHYSEYLSPGAPRVFRDRENCCERCGRCGVGWMGGVPQPPPFSYPGYHRLKPLALRAPFSRSRESNFLPGLFSRHPYYLSAWHRL